MIALPAERGASREAGWRQGSSEWDSRQRAHSSPSDRRPQKSAAEPGRKGEEGRRADGLRGPQSDWRQVGLNFVLGIQEWKIHVMGLWRPHLPQTTQEGHLVICVEVLSPLHPHQTPEREEEEEEVWSERSPAEQITVEEGRMAGRGAWQTIGSIQLDTLLNVLFRYCDYRLLP